MMFVKIDITINIYAWKLNPIHPGLKTNHILAKTSTHSKPNMYQL